MQEEKQRKLLKVRIGVAKFLQETISESGLKANEVVKSDEFKQFFRKASRPLCADGQRSVADLSDRFARSAGPVDRRVALEGGHHPRRQAL